MIRGLLRGGSTESSAIGADMLTSSSKKALSLAIPEVPLLREDGERRVARPRDLEGASTCNVTWE